MRILVLSQYFPPEPVPIPEAVAKAAASEKHHVRVLTGVPNYPQGVIYEGYKRGKRRKEKLGGIEIIRVPLFTDHSTSAYKRAFNYLSFALSSATRFPQGNAADVVYVYATQMTAAFGPWLWRKFGGPPYVLHIQDLWPDSVVGSSMVSSRVWVRLATHILNLWLTSVYRGAAEVIVIAPSMRDLLVNRGVNPQKVRVIGNWADENVPARLSSPNRDLSSPLVLVYAGNIGDMQDLETAVRAVASLEPGTVKLIVVGEGTQLKSLQQLVLELETDAVEFKPPVSPQEIHSVYANAHMSLIPLKNLPAFEGTIPSKFQGSLRNGLPIVTTVRGDTTRLVREYELGFGSPPEDEAALRDVLKKAASISPEDLEKMSVRARKCYRQNFAFTAGAAALSVALTQAAEAGRSQSAKQ